MTARARPRPLSDLHHRIRDLTEYRALTEHEIWSRTTASRTQVRAALNQLVARGLIQADDGRYRRTP